jgi:2-phosphosulfolactate phosphatase
MPTAYVHLLPDLVAEEKLAGSTAVVIDVLRATTTIVHALAAGARQIIPCLTVEDARAAAARLANEKALLGGERQGVRIEGFDLGNSPTEYTLATVGGRTLVFTTTNGTRAMLRCRQARQVLLAAFANRSAVLAALAAEPVVHIVCAGTGGLITREDVLVAGSLVAGLNANSAAWELNDEAAIARDAWLAVGVETDLASGKRELAGIANDRAPATSERLVRALEASHGGRNLLREGFPQDIATAAQLDRFDILPRLTWPDGVVRLAAKA